MSIIKYSGQAKAWSSVISDDMPPSTQLGTATSAKSLGLTGTFQMILSTVDYKTSLS